MKKPFCDEISGSPGNRKADRDNGKTSVGGSFLMILKLSCTVFSLHKMSCT